MLNPHDKNLVDRDPHVPGLGTLLDPFAFQDHLKGLLPGTEVSNVQANYVRYKPGTNCLVAYQANLNGSVTAIYARTFGRDASLKLQAIEEKLSLSETGSSRFFIDEKLAAAIYIFPTDKSLKFIPRLDNSRARKKLLQRMFPGNQDLWNSEIRPLRYKPQRRYVAQLIGPDGPFGVLKAYTKLGYQAAKAGAKAFKSRKFLQIPRIIGKRNYLQMLVSEWIDIPTLTQAASKFDGAIWETVGAALAELHSQKPKDLPVITRKMEADKVLKIAEAVSGICPHLSAWANRIAHELGEKLLQEKVSQKPFHGDFYVEQILVADEKIIFLDFDRAGLGDPARDLGRFFAQFFRNALMGERSPENFPAIQKAFLDGYENAADSSPISRKDLYTAMELFGLSLDPFRLRKPEWPHTIEAFLRKVESLLPSAGKPFQVLLSGNGGASKKGSDVTVSDPQGAMADPDMPFLAKALNPKIMQERFSQCLPELNNKTIHLLAIRAARYKPGLRCLIEYDLRIENPEGPPELITLMGKGRTRKIDFITLEFQTYLSNNSFRAGSSDGISVPQPLGTLPDMNLWLYRRVAGIPSSELFQKPGGVELAKRIAHLAHKLHSENLRPKRVHSIEEELNILQERFDVLGKSKPRWKTRLEHILDNCRHLASITPQPMSAAIHRDFYPDQVLVDGSRLYLLDLDLCCEGCPTLDIGNFIAHLTEYAIRFMGDPEALLEQEKVLEEEYLSLAGADLQPSLNMYTLLSLIRHISISDQFPDRRPFTPTILELCEQRLGALLSSAGLIMI